jgi:hypothetical protein
VCIQDWGGELTFPLPATSSTPRTWMQDQEEVWLAGNTPLPARPPVPLDSPLFQPGSYKVRAQYIESALILIGAHTSYSNQRDRRSMVSRAPIR